MADEARQRLNQLHPDPPVPPRPTAEYQFLLEEPRHEKPPLPEDQADEGQSNEDESSERDSGDERLD
jgi:hypothetical protein